MNPIKKIRTDKNLAVNEFAKILDSNALTIKNVEKGNCLNTTYMSIIKKMSLQFDDIDDGELLRKYKKWEDKDFP